MIQRAIAFAAGSILAIVFAAAVGILGPKPWASGTGTEDQVIIRDELDESAPSVAARTETISESRPLAGRREAIRRLRIRRDARKEAQGPPAEDLDGALRRALDRRGLVLEDLAEIPETADALRALEKRREPREQELLLQALEGAHIGAELPRRKLERAGEALRSARSAIPKERLQTLEARYLDLDNELGRPNGERERLGLLVRIAALRREIEAER